MCARACVSVCVCVCVLGDLDCSPTVGAVQLEGGAGHLGPLPVRGDPRAAEGGGAVPHQGWALRDRPHHLRDPTPLFGPVQ